MLKRALKAIYDAVPAKQRVFAHLRRFNLSERLYRHLHFRGIFHADLGRGRSFAMRHHGNLIENCLFWSGFCGDHEGMSGRLWLRMCDGHGLILDVGANTGVYALAAKAWAGSKVEVHAFEPVARIADALRYNSKLNQDSVSIHQIAASDRNGSATLYDFDTPLPSSASIECPMPSSQTSLTAAVDTARIDDLFPASDHGRVIACKIDVERHEPAVLRGMQKILEYSHPPLLIEILDEEIGQEVETILKPLGYRFWHVNERQGLVPLKRLAVHDRDNRNVLACSQMQFDRMKLEDLRVKLGTRMTRSPAAA